MTRMHHHHDSPLQLSIKYLRTFLFYVVYVVFTEVFCLLAALVIWAFPFEKRFAALTVWNKTIIFLCKYMLGIHYNVTGRENIPAQGPYVILSKHQSQWETFFLLLLFRPVSIILKKELLDIPGFGWGLRMLKPIPIDRENPKQAMKQIQSEGLLRLQQDRIPVLIFPEGTRMPFGKIGRYARGGATLAIAADVPVIFVSHNAGFFWPADGFLKHPGTVEVVISKPVSSTGKTALELTQEAHDWIEANIRPPVLR